MQKVYLYVDRLQGIMYIKTVQRHMHLFKGLILAQTSPNLQAELAKKSHEPSRAENPPARAESELSRAELSSNASLVTIPLHLSLV